MSAEDPKKKAEEAYAAAATSGEAQTASAVADKPHQGDVKPHDLPPLDGNAAGGEAGTMNLLMGISVPVVAQLGSTEMRIKEILRLVPGSIVALEKLAGDPVDLFVRGKLFAQGEVVVVDDSFGIRITKIIEPNENVAVLAG